MNPGAAAQQEWVPGWDARSEGGSPALPPPERLVPNQAAEQVQLFFCVVPGMSVLSEQAGVLHTCGKPGWLQVCAVALGAF